MTDVLGIDGSVRSKVELPETVFGRETEQGLLWESVKVHLANQRQGTASAKTRSEVSGTGKKPFRQKHTGNARHGSRRSPIFRGGGIAWGPRPRDYSHAMPKKKRRAALLSALSVRNAEGNVIIVEDFDLARPKTKELVDAMKALLVRQGKGEVQQTAVAAGSERKEPLTESVAEATPGKARSGRAMPSVLLMVGTASESMTRASRNVPWLSVIPSTQVNVYAALGHEKLVFTRTGLDRFLAMTAKGAV